MATRARAWSSGIIAVVAGFAIVGDWNMGAGEWVNRTMVKSRRRPGAFAMAAFAGGWELVGGVIGVGRRIEIAQVATNAGVWGIGIVAIVTGVAVVGNRNVRPVERVERIVVKGRRRPGAFRVAICASRRELRCKVVRIGSSIVVRLMAACTGIRCVVVIAVVASCTVVGDWNMRSIQHIIIVVDWESGRIPSGVRCMAHRTIRRQP